MTIMCKDNVSSRTPRLSKYTEDASFNSSTASTEPTPERQSPPPPNLIASPPSSSDESPCNHGWANYAENRPRRRCSLSSCAENTILPQRICRSVRGCARDTLSVAAGCACSGPNQNRRLKRKRSRRSANRRGSRSNGSACLGSDNNGGGTCITIHLPPTNILHSTIAKVASFLLFVYLLCLMRWVVDSQKHSLRIAQEVKESLRKETDIAREATQTLKELELEFQEELRLASAASSAATLASGRQAHAKFHADGIGSTFVGVDASPASTLIETDIKSSVQTPRVARQGRNVDHGRLRR